MSLDNNDTIEALSKVENLAVELCLYRTWMKLLHPTEYKILNDMISVVDDLIVSGKIPEEEVRRAVASLKGIKDANVDNAT